MANMELKNLYHRLRHFILANWLILKYSFRSLSCMAQGDHKGTDVIRVDDFISHKSIGDFPLSFWDYDFVIEIAKNIRKNIFGSSYVIYISESEVFSQIGEKTNRKVKIFQYVCELCGYTVDMSNSIYELNSIL